MRTAIIGGGIAGIAAAYELELARTAGANVEYTLFESSARLGGSLSSQTVDGSVLEHGPDSFLTEKTATAELCRELGLGKDLLPSNDAARNTYIVVRNRLVPLPDGLMFLVPTKLIPTALTPLFSLGTKIKMGMEFLHPPRPSQAEDESVAEFVTRHFGLEAVDRLADPLLSGIYGGDATQLSVNSVLPRMVDMERAYGSLTRGMLAANRRMRAKMADLKKSSSSAPRAIFTTLRGGMQQLVDATQKNIHPDFIRLNASVSRLERRNNGWNVESNGNSESYDSVIFATPAWAAAVLLHPTDAVLGEDLGAIPYSSSITVNLVYDEAAIGELPAGFGFLVPSSENRSLMACTFVHRKFLGRTAPGKVVLRAFLGGMKNEAQLTESDEVLATKVRQDLSEILGSKVLSASTVPEHIQISRWRRAMAQYSVGHQQRIQRIHEHVALQPGLQLAGNAYDGIGISDCIRLGRKAAKTLLEREG